MMASRRKGDRIPESVLESVVNEICADEESGDEMMIPELDELNDSVFDSDIPQSDNENTASTCVVPNTSTSWTNDDIVPVIAPFTGDSGIKIDTTNINNNPFLWMKTFLDDNLVQYITNETNSYAHQYLTPREVIRKVKTMHAILII